ncbi:MAG: hypothetical protein Q8M71_01760, partial [Thermodesulfovibrionales bacterium]|nr:hypothetical protein [Thermodesulfovibrionales bacterium]
FACFFQDILAVLKEVQQYSGSKLLSGIYLFSYCYCITFPAQNKPEGFIFWCGILMRKTGKWSYVSIRFVPEKYWRGLYIINV